MAVSDQKIRNREAPSLICRSQSAIIVRNNGFILLHSFCAVAFALDF